MPIIEYLDGSVVYQFPLQQGPCPVWSLFPTVGEAISETSKNMQLPVELAFQAALGAVAQVCQPFISVQCPSYDPDPVGIILIAVSNSGDGKSPLMKRFLQPVEAFECEQATEMQVLLAEYRALLKLWEDDGRRLAKDYREAEPGSDSATALRKQRLQHEKNRPVKPKAWQMRYGEINPQGLRDALVAYPAVAVWSPEASSVFNGMTLSQPDMISGYWSGEDKPVGLVSGSRRPVAPCFSMTAMLQEEQFAIYMKNRGSAAFATGLLARCLFVFSRTLDYYGKEVVIEALPHLKLDRFHQQLSKIVRQALPAPGKRLILQLSKPAKWYWKLFKEAIHNELICGNYSDAVKSFFRKIAQHAARLAAVLHYFEGASGDVSPQAMKSAIALCEWYLHEWIREFTPYAPSQQQQDEEAAHKLLQWLQEATAKPSRYPKLMPGRYTERDLRNYSRFRGNPEALETAINRLQAQGQIAVQTGPKGGRVIFYPTWAAPVSSTFNHSFSGQPMQSNFNASFDGAPGMVAQHPGSPMQPMLAHPTAGNNDTVNQPGQEVPYSVGPPHPTVRFDTDELDSKDMRAVRRSLAKRALEALEDPPETTVHYPRG